MVCVKLECSVQFAIGMGATKRFRIQFKHCIIQTSNVVVVFLLTSLTIENDVSVHKRIAKKLIQPPPTPKGCSSNIESDARPTLWLFFKWVLNQISVHTRFTEKKNNSTPAIGVRPRGAEGAAAPPGKNSVGQFQVISKQSGNFLAGYLRFERIVFELNIIWG